MKRSFYGKEDHGLELRLMQELPQILRWAIDGWKILRELGRFEQPVSGQEAIRELEELGSPVAAFVRDSCEIRPGAEETADDLYSAWKDWCEENGREHTGTKQTFMRDLRSVVPAITERQIRTGNDKRVRKYEGVAVKKV
jgi:putative DNA primase/helicase